MTDLDSPLILTADLGMDCQDLASNCKTAETSINGPLIQNGTIEKSGECKYSGCTCKESDEDDMDELLNSLRNSYNELLIIDDSELEDKNKLQLKLKTLQRCFHQLIEENGLLVATVSELEREAGQRVLQMETRLRKSAKSTMEAVLHIQECEEEMRRLVMERLHVESVFEDVQHQLTALKVENGFLRDQNANLHHDIDGLLHIIQQARTTGNWEMDSMTFCEVTPEQVFGPIHSVSQRTSLESLNFPISSQGIDGLRTQCYSPSEEGSCSLLNFIDGEKHPHRTTIEGSPVDSRLHEELSRLKHIREETQLELLQKDKLIASLESQITALNHELTAKEAECERHLLELSEHQVNSQRSAMSVHMSSPHSCISGREDIGNSPFDVEREMFYLENKTIESCMVQQAIQTDFYYEDSKSDEWRTEPKGFEVIQSKRSLSDIKRIKRTKSESYLTLHKRNCKSDDSANHRRTLFAKSLPLDFDSGTSSSSLCDTCCCFMDVHQKDTRKRVQSLNPLPEITSMQQPQLLKEQENRIYENQKENHTYAATDCWENERNALLYFNGPLSPGIRSEPHMHFLNVRDDCCKYASSAKGKKSTSVQTENNVRISQSIQTVCEESRKLLCTVPTQTDMTEVLSAAENECKTITVIELQQTLNYYREQIQKAEDKALSKEMLVNQLQSHVQTTLTEVELKDKALSNLERKLDSSRQECVTLRDQIIKLKEELESLSKKIAEKDSATISLKNEVVVIEEKIEEMQQKEAELQEQKRCLMVQLDTQGEELFKANDELNLAKQHLLLYNKEVKQLNTTIQTLQAAVVQSRRSLDEARKINENNTMQSKYYNSTGGRSSVGSLIMDI